MHRFRTRFLVVGCTLVLAALLLTDPDRGLSTGMLILALVVPLLAVAFAHLARKALHDYPEADMRSLFAKAGESPIGAGLALIALALVASALLGLFGRSAHAQGHPQAQPGPHARALPLAPTMAAEIFRHWPELAWPHYVPALIEHESCLSLTHSRCWQPTSRLKSQREEGAGLGQLTRAWRPDGTLRFDALAEMRQRHPALAELDWATIYQRPDLQIRALVLMSADNWRALRLVSDHWERLAMTDAAYNGGLGGVQSERRACGLRAGCDPQRWFGHVETVCLKSRQPLYAGRSACDINRHHVQDVLHTRMPRYRRIFAT
jgi:hypothetical protein